MLSPRRVTALLLWMSTLAAVGRANHVDDRISFGGGRAVADDHNYGVRGWHIQAEGHTPDILSDRLILTPQYPGNKRGALWSNIASNAQEWTVDFEFRANGEERASGNLQLWYVKDGASTVGTASIYTVGKFDGLAIVIDTHSGVGSVRGFLNDGNTEYKHHMSVDSLAFGHCAYHYRNLGRTSKLQIQHSRTKFEVKVDGNTCFSTDKVVLLPGDHFGITAASADTPDSFEVFQFTLSTPDAVTSHDSPPPHHEQQQSPPPPAAAQRAGEHQQDQQQHQQSTGEYQTGQHPDLLSVQGQINGISLHLTSIDQKLERILFEVAHQVHRVEELLQKTSTKEDTGKIEHQMSRVELMLRTVQNDLKERDYSQQFVKLQEMVHRSHGHLYDHFQDTSHKLLSGLPRMGFFVFLVLACQAGLAALYVLYKRRRAQTPKKYL